MLIHCDGFWLGCVCQRGTIILLTTLSSAGYSLQCHILWLWPVWSLHHCPSRLCRRGKAQNALISLKFRCYSTSRCSQCFIPCIWMSLLPQVIKASIAQVVGIAQGNLSVEDVNRAKWVWGGGKSLIWYELLIVSVLYSLFFILYVGQTDIYSPAHYYWHPFSLCTNCGISTEGNVSSETILLQIACVWYKTANDKEYLKRFNIMRKT